MLSSWLRHGDARPGEPIPTPEGGVDPVAESCGSTPMRVCVVDLSGPFGPLRSYLGLVAPLMRLGVEFDFVVPDHSLEILDTVAPTANIRVVPPRHSARRDMAVAVGVRRSMRAGSEVVHANTTSAARGAALGVAGSAARLVVHLRNSKLSRRERVMLAALSHLIGDIRFLAVSEIARHEAGPAVSARSIILKDPVSPVPLRPQLPPGPVARIGVVVNQQPTKGFDVFAETAVRLRGHSLHWEVFGSAGIEPPANDFVARSRDLLIRAGLERSVTYHGIVADLVERYATLDAVLVTSRRESFSLVCAETMLAGTPLVAPRIPGLLETIGGGRLAATYAVADAASAADALVGVLSRYPESLHRADEARAWALGQFDPDHVAQGLMGVYRGWAAR